MNEIILPGITPAPLAHYLKAIGLFRLFSEQKDSEAAACWRGERFTVLSTMTHFELLRFFLEEYDPTPILSPWNGRSGYLEGDSLGSSEPAASGSSTTPSGEPENSAGPTESNRRGSELLSLFRKSASRRLLGYRDLIAFLDNFEPIREQNDVRAKRKALENEKKRGRNSWNKERQMLLGGMTRREAFLKLNSRRLLRSALKDEQILWLDSVVAEASERAFSPLLGSSGGAEGSMDIAVNFMENLVAVMDVVDERGSPSAMSKNWLESSVFGSPTNLLYKNSSGSLAPERVGGPNATTGFSIKKYINPWDFILMIEGAIAFRPTMTRMLDSSQTSRMSFPFTVEPVMCGSGGLSYADQKRTRSGASEIWMPLWRSPAKYPELQELLREGRVRADAPIPQSGLDMARTIAKLGRSRGINSFQRFMFLKRSGDNDLAVPLARRHVSPEADAHVDLINDLERNTFLDSVRRLINDDDTAGGTRAAAALFMTALFRLTEVGIGRAKIEGALIQLGRLIQALSLDEKSKKIAKELPLLSSEWITATYNDSAEYRIALAMASLPGMAARIAPVEYTQKQSCWKWAPERAAWTWRERTLIKNLRSITEREILESEPFPGHTHLGAGCSHINAFFSEKTHDERIADLIQALVWVKAPATLPQLSERTGQLGPTEMLTIPSCYRILKPFFSPSDVLHDLQRLPEGSHLPRPREIVRLLCAQRPQDALNVAWRKSRAARIAWPKGEPPNVPTTVRGLRLLACLSIPIRLGDLAQITEAPHN